MLISIMASNRNVLSLDLITPMESAETIIKKHFNKNRKFTKYVTEVRVMMKMASKFQRTLRKWRIFEIGMQKYDTDENTNIIINEKQQFKSSKARLVADCIQNKRVLRSQKKKYNLRNSI